MNSLLKSYTILLQCPHHGAKTNKIHPLESCSRNLIILSGVWPFESIFSSYGLSGSFIVLFFVVWITLSFIWCTVFFVSYSCDFCVLCYDQVTYSLAFSFCCTAAIRNTYRSNDNPSCFTAARHSGSVWMLVMKSQYIATYWWIVFHSSDVILNITRNRYLSHPCHDSNLGIVNGSNDRCPPLNNNIFLSSLTFYLSTWYHRYYQILFEL